MPIHELSVAQAALIAGAVAHHQKMLIAWGNVRMTGQYGLRDVSLSTPCIVGSGGIESAIELRLNAEEQKALENSAAILKQAYAQLLTNQRSLRSS